MLDAYGVLQEFSSNLDIVVDGDYAYIIDDYRLAEADYNNGIYDKLPLKDIKEGHFTLDSVPEIYYDGWLDFNLNDDLRNEYGVSDNIIKQLERTPLSGWYDVLRDNDCERAATAFYEISETAKAMEQGEPIKALSDNQIESFLIANNYNIANELKGFIEQYNADCDYTYDEIENDER